MVANFLIGLREGLEAALVVAILVAYLVRIDQRQFLTRIWAGVGAAVGLSIIAVLALQLTGQALSDQAAEAFAGFMSLIAVALITWMILWMARHARTFRAHLHGEVDNALARSSWALVLVAFFAVGREGLETALFLWTGMRATGGGVLPVVGALLGLGTAVALGVVIYRGALRLNLSRLFFWTGIGLIVIAAGVLRYGVHELQEVGLLPGKDNYVLDVTGVINPEGVVATLLRTIFNIVPTMTALELLAWGGYLVIVLAIFLVVIRRPLPSAAPQQPAVRSEKAAAEVPVS